MIGTVTPNPCIDKTVEIPKLVPGGMNRIQTSRFEYAGKGFNVSKGVVQIGKKSTATGFLYSSDYEEAKSNFENDGLIVDCVVCPGRLRINTKIFDRESREVTELNESGAPVSPESISRLIEKVISLSRECDVLVFSGSLPPGCPPDLYKQLIENSGDCLTILDASGTALKHGIEAKPTMLKPNIFELETLVGHKLSSHTEILEVAKSFIAKGIQIVCVSMGEDGAIVTNGTESYFADSIKDITVRGTVCAGDSMVAGFATAFVDKLSLRDAFIRGVASATACVVQEGSAFVTRDLMNEMIPKVVVVDLLGQ